MHAPTIPLQKLAGTFVYVSFEAENLSNRLRSSWDSGLRTGCVTVAQSIPDPWRSPCHVPRHIKYAQTMWPRTLNSAPMPQQFLAQSVARSLANPWCTCGDPGCRPWRTVLETPHMALRQNKRHPPPRKVCLRHIVVPSGKRRLLNDRANCKHQHHKSTQVILFPAYHFSLLATTNTHPSVPLTNMPWATKS